MKPNDSVVEDDSRDDEMILYENRKKIKQVEERMKGG